MRSPTRRQLGSFTAAGDVNQASFVGANAVNLLVETVILNLARGTGLHGLSGIAERRGNIVRPLLPFTKAEARRFCTENKLWFHDDPANEDMGFSRVLVRKLVVTQLEKIHPAAKQSIARMAKRFTVSATYSART